MRNLLAAFTVTALTAVPAFASDLTVTLDEVRTITFGKPVQTIYVGNPSIADISLIDTRHAFIQGKGYGSTNIVALNDKGVQISNTRVTVLANQQQSTVTLNRGAARVTYSCTANHCEPTPQPGDGKDAFESGSSETSAHQDVAKKAATASAQ